MLFYLIRGYTGVEGLEQGVARAALEEQGTLCIGIYRLLEEEEDAEDQVSM